MDIIKFNEKLNKIDGNTYVIEEVITPVNGIYEEELAHDDINLTTLNIYTGSKLTGDKINTYSTSTPSLTPWKTIIKIYSNISPLYISYETTGDTVEAEDINNLQDAVVDTQKNLNNEIDRATNSESIITNNLNSEISRAENAENTLSSNLSAEITRAKAAENTITNTINSNKPNWDDKYTKNEIDNKISAVVTSLDYKEHVATFRDLATTYQNPQDGWTVSVDADNITYKYNGSTWIPISANSIPMASSTTDGKMSKQDKIDHDDMVSKRHTHSNKGILDVITQSLLDAWNAAYTHISDTVKHITSSERANWNTAYTNNHTHSNKSIIDSITQSLIDTWNSAYTHISDSVKHITSTERTSWNNKLDSSANAVSASKLATTRTIALIGLVAGSGNFDGSANLNINTSWNPTALTSEDLNSCTTVGQYYSSGGNTVSNKPNGADAFGIDVIKVAGGWILQILYDSNIGSKIYYRYFNGSAWLNWYQLYDSNNKPTRGDVGLGNVDNTSDLNKPISTAVQSALNGKSNSSHIHDDRYYTETEADNKFATKDQIPQAGYGDMLKSTYDKDNDGIVDKAEIADKWTNARTISLTGDASGSATIDGSSNVSINTSSRKIAFVGSDVASSNGWYKVASQTMNSYGDTNILFAVTSTYSNYYSGILQLQMRTDNTSISCRIFQWHTRIGFNPNDFIININGMTWTLYAKQNCYQYGRLAFEILSESSITDKHEGWLLNFNDNLTLETTIPTATVTSSDGATVSTANKLTTARNIALTGDVTGSASFDGSTNVSITTNLKTGLTWNDLEGV